MNEVQMAERRRINIMILGVGFVLMVVVSLIAASLGTRSGSADYTPPPISSGVAQDKEVDGLLRKRDSELSENERIQKEAF